MKLDRRNFLFGTIAAASQPVRSESAPVYRPEDFGARGDGSTNDTAAFARVGAAVNRQGGGTIELRAGRTYVVGAQLRTASGWKPQPILELAKLTRPLAILGNGARLLAQPGLRYGTFNGETGEPVHHPMPYLDRSDVAAAYLGMILIRECAASVVVRDLELDGNVGNLLIGGQYGDTGWQIPATGLFFAGNLAEEIVENVHSHHHAQDGAIFIGARARSGRGTVRRFVSQFNGRQGLSITGGRGYDFADCEFSNNARVKVKSPPGAGVDVEAEDNPIEDISFTRCRFMDNGGCGFVADSGVSRNLRFADCRFVGSKVWSAWPRKPGSRFTGCTFVGSVVHAFADRDPRQATHFIDCLFTDDPALSPTHEVYTGDGPIVNLAESENVLFDRCRFRLVAAGTLPWSWKAIYRDCVMIQKSVRSTNPKGRYLGRTTIQGPADLYGSMIEGEVVLNGHRLAPGPIGVAPW